MNVKDQIEQRLSDLRAALDSTESRAALIEVTALKMAYNDLIQAAQVARAVAVEAAVADYQEPTIQDVMSINQLYQAYIGPAYQVLVSRGEIPPPAVMTTPASSEGVKSKSDLAS